MKHSFEDALVRLLAHEGGYTNHPDDPGGPTKFGITIHDYRKYTKPNAIASDVKAMTIEAAKAIYRARYWDAQRCDDLPAGVDYAVFDYGVNSGIGRSGKVLRRVLTLPDDTSRVSDAVVAAAQSADAAQIVRALCDERLRFLQSLKTWGVFGKGWARRVAEVKLAALTMAAQAKSVPTPAGQAPGRGQVPLSKLSQRGSVGVIALGGLTAAQQAHQGGAPASVAAAIVAAAAVLAGGVWGFWRWRQRREQQKRA